MIKHERLLPLPPPGDSVQMVSVNSCTAEYAGKGQLTPQATRAGFSCKLPSELVQR